MMIIIQLGVEMEYCQFVLLLVEGIYVNCDEVQFSSGSYYFFFYFMFYSDILIQIMSGKIVDMSGVFLCDDGFMVDWLIEKFIGGS